MKKRQNMIKLNSLIIQLKVEKKCIYRYQRKSNNYLLKLEMRKIGGLIHRIMKSKSKVNSLQKKER